ncbi:RNA polymerase sigma factor [Luteolibacter soli]|uniref:Sigma-70 family RNA polymerase sigma factor n=1 Tax=Luteolibacter soli TaxID=3135280 RepID=A0ABU9B2C1_9BACT
MDDRSLLDRYLATRDESAFRELVSRHLDLVHTVARRVTGNDELARDAAQATFVKLARDAAKVPPTISLVAWLHRTSRCAAVDLVRSEDRRRKREQLAHQHMPMNATPEPEWERLAPVIDEAVDSLPAADRELVLAKYYGNETFAGIATRFGWTEANARKRASRSLEKLRHLLGKRDLTTTAVALATALPLHSVSPAPSSLTGAVLAAASKTAPAQTLGFNIAMTTAQKSAAAAAVVALLASGWTGHALGSASGREQQLSLSTGRPGSAASLVTAAVDRRPVEVDPATAFECLLAGEDRRTWAVVSRLDAKTMPVWMEKLHKLQASTPRASAEWERLTEIESALYFHWADADPQAAWKEVAAIPDSNDHSVSGHTKALVESVLAAWMRRSPDEAYNAAKDHPDHGYTARDMLILTWTPETLEENLAKHEDKRDDLLGWFCGSIVGDQAKREAVIKYLLQDPPPKEAAWGRKLFFRSWGYEDFLAAMARAEELKLPDMQRLLFQDNLPNNPITVMPWAISKGMAPGGPQWEQGYQQWLQVEPAEARAWFETQAPAWERDGHDSAVAGFFASELAIASLSAKSGKPDPAAEQAAAKRLSEFLSRWSAKDSAAELKWRNAASKETRDRLAETEASR